MKNKLSNIYTLSLVMISLALPFQSEAKSERSRNERRESRQQGRIAEGIRSGELTHKEAKHLKREQHRIDHAQEKAMADGVETPAEKAKIEKMQDHASKDIYKQKHDEQKRSEK